MRRIGSLRVVAVLAAGVLGSLASSSFAQVTLPDLGISASDYTSSMATSVGPWIAGGLGLGVVVLAVILGWRKLKTVVR